MNVSQAQRRALMELIEIADDFFDELDRLDPQYEHRRTGREVHRSGVKGKVEGRC